MSVLPYYDPYMIGSGVPIQAVPYQQGIATPITNVGPAQNGAPQFAGIQYVFVEDPLLELDSCTGVIIRQQPEIFEAIMGCETANRYHVFGITPQGHKYLFKCRERSEVCGRICCPAEMREFNMEIYHAVSSGLLNNLKTFAEGFKPLKCPCCCLNRPVMIVKTNQQYVGKIVHLFSCMDPEFEVFDANGTLKYSVHADCCQCGIACSKNICGKFSNALFEVYDGRTHNLVANINKMSAQSFSEVVTDADSYTVTFPQNASAFDKLLLITLGLMIDYQYFETNANDNNSGIYGGGYRRRYYY